MLVSSLSNVVKDYASVFENNLPHHYCGEKMRVDVYAPNHVHDLDAWEFGISAKCFHGCDPDLSFYWGKALITGPALAWGGTEFAIKAIGIELARLEDSMSKLILSHYTPLGTFNHLWGFQDNTNPCTYMLNTHTFLGSTYEG